MKVVLAGRILLLLLALLLLLIRLVKSSAATFLRLDMLIFDENVKKHI